ncbi:MAG: protein translocase subunit SecF [Clostridiales Family XIII bacterium]|jgi:SecD/SecF fusion protein|nr:protein translocase subunit SecF [Clostridiales Family XIII bacterium]
MAKKVIAVALTALIVLIWVATLHGVTVGGKSIGPINKDIKLGLDIKGGVYVVMEAQTGSIDQQDLPNIMEQTRSVIENRVNAMGLSEPIVTIEGDNRIRVELPGAEDAASAIETIGKTAQLRFLLADGSEALSGADIDNSGVDRAQNSAKYVVTLEFKAAGQQKFFDATTTAYNQTITSDQVMQPITAEQAAEAEKAKAAGEAPPVAPEVVATDASVEAEPDAAATEGADAAATDSAADAESTSSAATEEAAEEATSGAAADEQTTDSAATTSPGAADAAADEDADEANVQKFLDKDGNVISNPQSYSISANQIIIVLDNEIISAPGVNNGPIDSRSAIIEEFSLEEATELSMLIRGGALPVDLKEVESSEIGATIGMGALEDSVKGGIIGIILVLLLMLVMYRLFGLAANIALLLYVPLVLWWLTFSGAVLTLPGIAGIVLSIGMAVDANVIVISRIREEVGHGKTIRLARRDGFKKALSAVLDSQITTIIAAVVLYQLGTGPVRGFAFTLASGIIIGLITALLVANVYTDTFLEAPFLRKPALLGVKEGEADQHTELRHKFHIIKFRKIFYIVTVAILVVGISVGLYHGRDNQNIKFGNEGIDFSGGTRLQINMEKALPDSDIDKTLKKYGITDGEIVRYGKDNSGVIIKTTKALDTDARAKFLDGFLEDYGLSEKNVESFELFGPSIGRMLTDKAVQAVLWAALFMLIYISVRFRWRFGVASIIAVFHDVAILFAMYGLFNITVNNPFIAAVLTVVGYSINDTIVIFDRIRENFGTLSGRMPLPELIDKSVNQTLVRSLMTVTSTVIVIIPLIIFGGDTIREFTVPLLIGILAGACSSIFIASPVYYELTHIGEGGEGVKGHRRARTKYEESVAAAKAAKKAKKDEAEAKLRAEAEAKGLKDIDGAGRKSMAEREEELRNDQSGSDNDSGNGGGDKPTGGGGGAKGRSKKSKKKRKSSRSGGAVV